MRMNNETKITFALEHIAHLEDLIKDNIDEAILQAYLNDIKGMFERQLNKEQLKRRTKWQPEHIRLKRKMSNTIKSGVGMKLLKC